jgi:Inner membrane protein YgaP-like, transmembrane domain
MSFARIMASPIGRGARILVGVVLIIVGVSMGSAVGYVLAAVGVVPLVAGAFNVCLIAPLLKAPFRGDAAATKGRSGRVRACIREVTSGPTLPARLW